MAIKLAEAFVLINAKMDPLKKALGSLKEGIQGATEKLDQLGQQARIALAALATGVGTTAAVFASFEKQMNRVLAISSSSEEEFAALNAKAKELGATTQFSASQAAEAMGNFALAGFKTNKILDAMGPALDLAASGQMDVATASDIVAKIMAGMGLESNEVTHAVDVMAKAFTTANTDLVQLGEAMKFVGPIAKSAGKGIEETVAAVQALSDAGLQASLAGTSLRGILGKMAAEPTEVKKVFGELGVSIKDVRGFVRPLGDIIDDFNRRIQETGQEARVTEFALRAFGQRAGPGFAVLLARGGNELRRLEKQLSGAGGTAKRIAGIQLRGLSGAFTLMTSALEGASIAIGEKFAPMIQRAAGWVQGFASAIANARPQTLNDIASAIKRIGLALAGLALLPTIISGVTALVGAIAAIASPVGIVVGALAGLVASFVIVMKESNELQDAVSKSFSNIRKAAGLVGSGVADAFALGDLKLAWEILMEGMKAAWIQALMDMQNIFQKWIKGLSGSSIVDILLDPTGAIENGDMARMFGGDLGKSIEEEGLKAAQKLGNLLREASMRRSTRDAIENPEALTPGQQAEVDRVKAMRAARQRNTVSNPFPAVPFVGSATGAKSSVEDPLEGFNKGITNLRRTLEKRSNAIAANPAMAMPAIPGIGSIMGQGGALIKATKTATKEVAEGGIDAGTGFVGLADFSRSLIESLVAPKDKEEEQVKLQTKMEAHLKQLSQLAQQRQQPNPITVPGT